MSPSSAVIEVAEEHVQRIIVVLPSCNRDSGLVTAKTERDKHGTCAVGHLRCNCVLQ